MSTEPVVGDRVRFRSDVNGRHLSYSQGVVIEAGEGVRVRWLAYPESEGLYEYQRHEVEPTTEPALYPWPS